MDVFVFFVIGIFIYFFLIWKFLSLYGWLFKFLLYNGVDMLRLKGDVLIVVRVVMMNKNISLDMFCCFMFYF